MIKSLQKFTLAGAFAVALSLGANAQMTEGFEGQFLPECWTQIDADGDGEMWFQYDVVDEDVAYEGDFAVASASWLGAPLTPDNYLVTPQLSISDGDMLSFQVAAQDADWTAEKFAVYVSTAGNGEADFTDEIHVETLASAEWDVRELDMSDYAGEDVYIAFRHFDVTDQFYIKLDAIQLPGEFVNDCSVSTSVEELEAIEAKVYPNPANDQINIITDVEGEAQVKIVDNLGRTVYTNEHNLNGTATAINIADFAEGVYIIQIEKDNTVATQRFIKK